MEAKDTVMIRLWEGDGVGVSQRITSLLEQQAEISFKAGYKHALEGAVMNGAFDSIKKLGIKEVVGWIKSHQLIEPDKNSLSRFEPFYQIEQEKLKEWDIG